LKRSREVSTLVELVDYLAQTKPEAPAFIFLRDGVKDEVRMTHAELATQSKQIATLLKPHIAPGDRVLINHAPGLDYISSFFGCLYAGGIAVPVYPPRFNSKLDRLNSIAEDAQPKVALTSAAILANMQPLFPQNPSLAALKWIDTDTAKNAPEEDHKPAIDGNSLAFMQYTSGSTARPKGVMLSHRNLIENLTSINKFFSIGDAEVGVIWLPPYHDMGLVGGILGSLFSELPVVLMSPYAFAQRPIRWLRAITKYKGTMSGAPNFAYDLCVDRVTDEQLAELDLSSWRLAFCGAEPVRADVLDRFAKKFAVCGFKREALYPCYGMAETTLIISGAKEPSPQLKVCYVDGYRLEHDGVAEVCPADGPRARSFVGCGQVMAPHVLRIVNTQTLEVCKDGEVGEIWFSGPSVAQGYWNRPKETKESFAATIKGDDRSYLRTGDLGFVLDGELYITSRIKDLIIFRGRNLYPHDIELSVERSHAQLRSGAGAAFSINVKDEERLVIVHELERKSQDANLDEIIEAIRKQVMEDHGIAPLAISLIQPHSIPVTSSGKIQRHASRELFLRGELNERKRFTESAQA